METIKIYLTAPGSCGDLEIEVTQQEREFVKRLAEAWNERNCLHAQPYFTISTDQEKR